MYNYMKTILSAVKFYIGKITDNINNKINEINNKIPTKTSQLENDSDYITKNEVSEQVQVDWNQNDETAVDYIKNKTHYTTIDKQQIILPKVTITENSQTIVASNLTPTFNAYPNTYFYLLINDQVYYESMSPAPTFPSKIISNSGSAPTWIHGNLHLYSEEYEDNGYPFCTYKSASSSNAVVLLKDPNNVPMTIEMFQGNINYHTLDEKFIPDSIARTEHHHSWNDLEDKPFGETVKENVYLDSKFTHAVMIDGYHAYDIEEPVDEDFINNLGEEMYVVTLNGTPYMCELLFEGEYIFNINEEWTLIFREHREIITELIYWNGSDENPPIEVDVKISSVPFETLVPIDEKYIPDNIPRKEDIPQEQIQSDWNVYDESDKSFVKNKTHYEYNKTNIQKYGFTNEEIKSKEFISKAIMGAYKLIDEPSLIPKDKELLLDILFDNIQYSSQDENCTYSESWIETNNTDVNDVRWIDLKQENRTICIIYIVYSDSFTFSGITMNKGVWYFSSYMSNYIKRTSYLSLSYEDTLVELKQLNEKYIPDTISRTNHVHSYNDLTDRTHGTKVEWNPVVSALFYNCTYIDGFMSYTTDSYIDKELFINGQKYLFSLNDITEEFIYEYNEDGGGCVELNDKGQLYIYEIEDEGLFVQLTLIPERFSEGYFDENPEILLTISEIKETVEQLDEKYIPDTIARKADVPTVEEILNALPTWTGGSY